MYSWLVRHTVNAYQTAEKDRPKCPDAVEFLKDACKLEAAQELTSSPEEVEKRGKALIDFGCDDPLVMLWYGHILFQNHKNRPSFKDAEPVLAKALDGLQKSGYPRIHRFHGACDLSEIYEDQGPDRKDAAKNIRIWAMRSLGEAIAAGEFSQSESRVALEFALRQRGITRFGFDEEKVVFEVIKDKPGIDPYVMNVLRAEREIVLAWDARGSGYASTVTEQGWAGFREHLERARSLLMSAWKAHPEYPEAPYSMIPVAMASSREAHDTPRFWFDQTVRAQFDYARAYDDMFYALDEKWSGVPGARLAFAEACLETKRFDTDVPLFYLKTLRSLSLDQKDDSWRSYFRNSRVRKNLDRLFEGMVKEPSRAKDRQRILAQQAFAAVWCGDYEKARTVLKEVRPDIDVMDGFWKRSLSYSSAPVQLVEAEIRTSTGPQKKTLEQAEASLAEGKPQQAIKLFEAALKASDEDKGVCSYLRHRIAFVEMANDPEKPNAHSNVLFTTIERNHKKLTRYLLENGEDPNPKSWKGDTPLHVTCREGDKEVAALLLQHGADLKLKDAEDRTPLCVAIMKGKPELIELLLKNQADINGTGDSRWTPLHTAVAYRDLGIADSLIGKGADINVLNSEHTTPLLLAIIGRDPKGARYLIEKGADIKIANDKGMTAPHLAVNGRMSEMAVLLIEKGADVNAVTAPGNNTPLHLAIRTSQPEIVAMLLGKGADVTVAERPGNWTPLHLAAYYGNKDVVGALLKKGAERSAKLQSGATPLDLAQQRNLNEIVALLSQ